MMFAPMIIRDEIRADIETIRAVVTEAFKDAAHAGGTEAGIVDRLRTDDALTLSLVAGDFREVVGHVAFSPVSIDGRRLGWFGLGPVAVGRRAQMDATFWVILTTLGGSASKVIRNSVSRMPQSSISRD
jgi:predicted N-acetyltransferase YhbS